MILFLSGCKQGNQVLCIPNLTFQCEQPDFYMIAPLDIEALAPDELYVVSDLIYLTHAPVIMELLAGIRLNCPAPASGNVAVQILADGVEIFTVDQLITGGTRVVAPDQIKPAYRTIAAGVKLQLLIKSISLPYEEWKGLRVAFLPKAIEVPT